jgi:hypothetical protein
MSNRVSAAYQPGKDNHDGHYHTLYCILELLLLAPLPRPPDLHCPHERKRHRRLSTMDMIKRLAYICAVLMIICRVATGGRGIR